jgi:hypothetical protein
MSGFSLAVILKLSPLLICPMSSFQVAAGSDRGGPGRKTWLLKLLQPEGLATTPYQLRHEDLLIGGARWQIIR